MIKNILVSIFCLILVSSCSTGKKVNEQPGKPKSFEAIYRSPQESARFPGCEDKVDEYRMGCSQMKLSDYVKANMKYPKDCVKDSLEGMSFVSFVVDTNGVVSQVSLDKKSVNPSMDQEAIRIVKTFNKMDAKWIPAMQHGVKVSSELVIPIKFKIRKPKLQMAAPDEDAPEDPANK